MFKSLLKYFFKDKKKPNTDEDLEILLNNINYYNIVDNSKNLCHHYITEIEKDLTFTNIKDLSFFDANWFFKYYIEFEIFNKIINNQLLKNKISKDVNKVYLYCNNEIIGYFKTANETNMIGIINLENYYYF